MPFYFDQGGTNRYTLQDFEPSFGTKMGAAVDEAWAESYGPVVADWARKQLSTGPKLSAIDADSYIKQSGLRIDLKPKDNEYSQDQLDIILERQRELTIAKDIRERTPWDWGSPVRGLAMFGAGIVDPINLATAFVPWTRAMSIARPLEAARLSTSALTRFGGRAGLGAIDAGISTLALEPAYAYMRRDLGDDYDAYDSMVNIAFGAAFGGGVLGLGGVGVDAFRKATGRIAPSERFRGLSNEDIQLVTNLEREIANGMPMADVQKVLATYSPEMRRAAGFGETVLQPGRPRTMSHRVVEQDGQLMARSDAGFVSGAVEGDRLVINIANVAERYDALGDNVTLFQRLIDSAIDRGLTVDSDAVVDANTVRVYEALANEGFVVSRSDGVTVLQPSDALPNGGLMSADGVSPVFRVSRGAGYTKPLDTARDVVERIDPETREATFRAGVAQMMDGRNISVDSIINTDPASGGAATAQDIEASAKLNQQAESIRTADFDASSKIDEENKTSPRWDGISDAEQALNDADAQLNDTIKTGADAFKYARSQGGAEKPGVGVEAGNKLGFEPALRVKAPIGRMKLPEKPLILTGTNNKNAAKQINAIDGILKKFPKAGESADEWARMLAYAFGSEEVPIPPYAFLRDINSDNATQKLSKLTDGQIADATHGFENAAAFRAAYIGKQLDVVTTGKLFMWSFLSRGVSPYVQESLFIDAFPGVDEWIRRAADGNFTESDFPAYEAWAKSVAPAGSEQPGAGATHNLNAFGKSFLFKMGAKGEDGISNLQRLHTLMEDPNATGKQIRREFAKFGEGVGIDDKVVSFTLLVAGFDDVMVLDRVQVRQLWDDGRFSGRNLYDGRKADNKAVAGTSLADLTMGARGLLIYEAIERTLADKIQAIYKALGREKDASIGRYHWESWVADSQQEASHGTLGAILPDAKGDDLAIARVTAKQGEYGAYEYGAMYGRDAEGTPFFVYNTPDGQQFEFSVPAFREFLTDIKRPAAGVVPTKFKVTESGNAPWYTRPEVNQEKLSEAAIRWADRAGGSGEGARLIQAALNGQELPGGAGARFARGAAEDGTTPDVQLAESIRQSFGNATHALLDAGQIRLVNTPADIPGGPHPADVKAATAPDGTVYMVAENISSREVKGLVLHEVGVHVGMEKMLGAETFSAVLTQLDDAIIRGESWAMAARDAVPSDTLPQHIREEQLAYLVQNSPDLPIVKQIIAAIRAWVFRTFETARERMTLTEDDFRALAISALKYTARTELTPPVLREGKLVSVFARSIDQIATPEFRRWFGKSKIVDADGKPMVMYHGTPSSFDEFGIPEFRGAVFFSPDPKFAGGYSGSELVSKYGGTPNVMPVYIKSSNPFDYENPTHIEKIKNFLPEWNEYSEYKKLLFEQLPTGNWEFIEDKAVLEAIKKAGFDAFYVMEDGAKNLGVFDPTQVKSATGNFGTFDPANPDVRYSRGTTQDTSTDGDALKAADASLRRAKQYSSVLRAAADKLDNDADAVNAMKSQLPDITAEEIDQLLNGLRKQVKNMRNMTRAAKEAVLAGDRVNEMQSEAMQAADMLANNLAMAAVIARRGEALDINARLKASTFLQQFRDKGLDFEGFAALLVGSERVRVGSRVSVDAEYKGFRGEWLGGMIADLEKANLKREFISGSFDRDIYDALWRMGQDNPDMTGLSPQVVKMAEIVNKYQTNARNRRNRFGAWIRDLQGYITRQSHDMYKIRAVTDEEWIAFVKDRLDLPKMMRLGLISEDDTIGSLRALYDQFSSGLHMKGVAGEEDVVAFKLGANLAKRESVSRALYFKDGIAAYEYNDKFGSGRLAESVILGLDHAARSAALLKTLGRNPMVTLTRLMDEYQDSITDPKRRSQFYQDRGKILNLLAQVDGSVNIPGNVTAAKVGSFMRSWQSMAKLGGALISSFSDLAGYAAELRYSQGKNMLSGVADGIGALIKGRGKGERAEILASLGVFHESVAGAISARFDSPDLVSGKMAAAMQQFFRLNGLTWWTETLRDGAALSHSHYMALQAARPFDRIDPEMQRLLTVYKIDAAKWNLMRMATMQMADGRAYMTPEALRTIPRSAMEDYIASTGRTVSDVSVQNLIDDLSQTLRLMAVDRAHHAVIEPSARTRAWMLRGTKPGTVAGELLRYIGQFKSFSVAMVHSVLGREVYGRGYDTVGEYLKKGRGDMLGLANMIGLYGLLGYASMSIKDLIKGRKPRDPLDPKTVMAALAQGGGMGLYGDFLFGEYSRFGRSFTSSLAGPVLGQLDTLTDLWTRLRKGDDMAAASFRALLENTPFANLFWIRPLLDYAVIWNIQESLNPGYLRRMESRIERENNQEFILRPSEVVR